MPKRKSTLPDHEQRLIWLMKRIEFDTNGGCWLWSRAVNTHGYGRMWDPVSMTRRTAHRVSLEMFHGPLPPGMCALHRCDTPACVNPDHLYAGTAADNIRDRVKRSRGNRPRGERNVRAVLSEQDVRAIRASRESVGVLAARYGASEGTIHCARTGRTWGHLPGAVPAVSNARKTHCIWGHAFTPENTHIKANNRRDCRRCDAIRHADRKRNDLGRPERCSPDLMAREARRIARDRDGM